MRYDTWRGGAYFAGGQRGGPYSLWNYLHRAGRFGNIANCYDQAGAVQCFSGSLGIWPTWIFLDPYGWIQQTNLVGVGACNNPFFSGNGTTPIMDPESMQRTGFGNHAFIEHGSHAGSMAAAGAAIGSLAGAPLGLGIGALIGGLCGGPGGAAVGAGIGALVGLVGGAIIGAVVGAVMGGAMGGYIFDACAGPHMGTESRSEYAAASIDYTTTLYARGGPGPSQPGTAAMMAICTGVSGIQ
jgi:hypothetical protein